MKTLLSHQRKSAGVSRPRLVRLTNLRHSNPSKLSHHRTKLFSPIHQKSRFIIPNLPIRRQMSTASQPQPQPQQQPQQQSGSTRPPKGKGAKTAGANLKSDPGLAKIKLYRNLRSLKDEAQWASKKSRSFSIATWNVLCQSYAQAFCGYSVSDALDASFRQKGILMEIQRLNADILCLQELDGFDYWASKLTGLGYTGVYKPRASFKPDGCATFFKQDKWDLNEKKDIMFNQLKETHTPSDIYNTHNVAVLLNLTHKATQQQVTVANCHLHWNPRFPEVKFAQAKLLVEESQQFKHPSSSLILCGDFNSVPSSSVYKYLREGILDKENSEWHPSDAQDADVVSERASQNLSESISEHISNYFAQHLSQQANPLIGNPLSSETGVEQLHDLQLKSVYEKFCHYGEPPYTNYTQAFQDTLDYIFYDSAKLEPVSLLEFPNDHFLRWQIALPNTQYPSDHLSLFSRLLFVE